MYIFILNHICLMQYNFFNIPGSITFIFFIFNVFNFAFDSIPFITIVRFMGSL